VLVLGVAGWVLLAPPEPADKPPAPLTPAQVAAKTPILPNGFTVSQNDNLQVVEVSVEKAPDGRYVVGTLKNTTGRRYRSAELAFDLTDEDGSQVGAATTRVAAVEPNGNVRFRFPVPQRNASIALVREVRGSF
jgi:hypothetical protein